MLVTAVIIGTIFIEYEYGNCGTRLRLLREVLILCELDAKLQYFYNYCTVYSNII